MNKLKYLFHILVVLILISSCKKECDDGIDFFGDCIENNNTHTIFQAEYELNPCKVTFLFDITYSDKIDVKEYQFSHSHRPEVTWTLAEDVKIGQQLNGGVICEENGNWGSEITQYYFVVPEESSLSIPVTIKFFNRVTFEAIDSTIIIFDRSN